MTYQNYEYPSMQIMTAKTDKFKNAYIEVNFREDIRKMNPASRVFLSSLMTYNSNIYKTRRELKIKQEELYNMIKNNLLNFKRESLLSDREVKIAKERKRKNRQLRKQRRQNAKRGINN